jgi:hypothetical protein
MSTQCRSFCCYTNRRKDSRKGIVWKKVQEERTDRKEDGLRLSGISTMTLSAWLSKPGEITPVVIVHGFIETSKETHHSKVQSYTRLEFCVGPWRNSNQV